MANEKVSQMTSLTANELARGDLFLITDISEKTSKKIAVSDIMTYIQETGSLSFNASDSIRSQTASWAHYIVGGLVPSSSLATTSSYVISSSHALNANSASYVVSASYVNITSAEIGTSSYLKYNGVFNGSSSYALTSSFVNNSQTSSFLLYTAGRNNGTASMVIGTSSYSLSSSHSEFAKSVTGTVHSTTSSWASSSVSSSWASNGIVNWFQTYTTGSQVGTLGTINNPFDIYNMSIPLNVTAINSTLLIMISVAVGHGVSTGSTNVALWRNSSVDNSSEPLISTIGSFNGNDEDCITLNTTYIHQPSYMPGTPITYSAKVFNSSGSWYINRNKNNTQFGTSSLSIIEFVSPF